LAEGGVAVVTGGGRGIGANIARALAGDGWSVVVAARTSSEIDAVATETDGRAVQMDVTSRESVERGFDAIGHVDLLVANAGGGNYDDWWRTFEVNVLGVHLCCEAALDRGCSRIIVIGSGAAYLPGASETAYTSSKAAVGRYAETLDNQGRAPVFLLSPGRVRTALTIGNFPDDDGKWTPPERAAELAVKLASGRYDALRGRYLHAEHDDVDDLLARIDEVRERDLNAIRLRR
jgi:NAD(P)-dependent dehydrogenase (short-subunit alcohol dehydrogenase family)